MMASLQAAGCFARGWIDLVVNSPAQKEQKILHPDLYDRFPGEMVSVDFLEKLESLGEDRVEGDRVIVKDVVMPLSAHIVKKESEVREMLRELLSEISTDPEDEPSVGEFCVHHKSAVHGFRRNDYEVAAPERLSAVTDLKFDISFHIEVELVIIVGMQVDIVVPGIAVVVDLEVLRQHILPVGKGCLDFRSHLDLLGCVKGTVPMSLR